MHIDIKDMDSKEASYIIFNGSMRNTQNTLQQMLRFIISPPTRIVLLGNEEETRTLRNALGLHGNVFHVGVYEAESSVTKPTLPI